jgi:hypothetical protein
MISEYADDYAAYRCSQPARNRLVNALRSAMYLDSRDPDYPDIPDGLDPEATLKAIDEDVL